MIGLNLDRFYEIYPNMFRSLRPYATLLCSCTFNTATIIISIPAVRVTSRPCKHSVFFHPITFMYEDKTSALTCKVLTSVSYFKTSKKLENTLKQHGELIHIQKCCTLSP